MRGLRETYLAYNMLRDLHKGIFTRLDQLLVLNRARNRLGINRFDETMYLGLIRLIARDLSYNAPTRIDARTLRDVFFLRTADLQKNTIDRIESDAILLLYNLHTLEQSEKRLHKLGAQRFNGLFVLNRLTLSGNAIANLDLAFRDCSNLKELHLSGNELTPEQDAPRDLALLKTLDHGENRSSLYSSSFRNLDPLTGP
ncbi:Leucine-rich repeats and immunoglobulin-like domains protein 2 [Melipona quadrifasciata]|uniref:Leucine-rich repeats and immunoglobulin-like domains protein 2 n=1 Tax=Melipona quadrifasciata TaxID=166423 RepID=A0A0M9AAX8_9HYME|nr:Leucine-rich repeats and immunoglobulin-like domains protein 2 [Melipona quadrifasciata]